MPLNFLLGSAVQTNNLEGTRAALRAQHPAREPGAPDPSLSAILLIVQSRGGSGSRLVFHYPPDPIRPNDANPKHDLGSAGIYEESSTSSSEDESSTESETPVPSRSGTKTDGWHGHRSWTSVADEDDDDVPSKEGVSQKDRPWEPSWEPLLGFGTDGLVGLLSPDRSWHKRKFEVGINNFYFIGWPVFARDDGTWKKQKHKTNKGRDLSMEDSIAATDSERELVDDGGPDREASKEDTGEGKLKKSEMTMFNVVFVLDPPILEDTARIKDMYDHIVKKFTRFLKWEQGRSEYVWHEAELIQSITSKHLSQQSPATSVYTEVLSRSSLATAISTVFLAISTSRIAQVTLSPNTSMSLQIPPVTSTSVMPSLTEPSAQPGLWLTTANDPPESSELDATTHSGSIQLAKQFTLLLKTTKPRILKDVQANGGPVAAPLSNFVLATNPTKSFYKISIASKISLSDIQLLSRHLIYWRRAIAIPPLNQRDTYVVSPNADMSKLKVASRAYEAAFPTLPPLPKLLSILGETPKPWYFLIPSTDHKETYYEVLAWLMRGGWVTQLRTFARVSVSPEVKKAVKRREAEEKNGVEQKYSTPEFEQSPENNSRHPKRPSIVSRPSSDAKFSTVTTSTATSSNQNNHRVTDNPNIATLIQNPSRASPLESSWLEYIADSLLTINYSASGKQCTDEDRAELRRLWPKFVKYFNGQEALENIPVREGMKRKFVWEVLGRMGLDFDGGVEKEDDGAQKEKRWLVTSRHW